MKKFKCNDCGHTWMGSEFTTTCPECGSSNIVMISDDKGGIIDLIIKNKFIVLGILAIIALFIFFKAPTPPPPPTEKGLEKPFSLVWPTQTINDNVYKIMLKDKNGKKFAFNEKRDGITFFAENISTNEKIIVKNGIIAPCFNKSNKETVRVTWEIKESRKGDFSGVNTLQFKQHDLKFETNKDKHKVASCYSAPVVKSVKYINKKNCDIKIEFVNIDNFDDHPEILVSISGKEGPFKNQNIWKYDPKTMKENNNIIVWTYLKDKKEETLKEYNQGDKYTCSPPKPITKEEIEKIKKDANSQVKSRFNALCNNQQSKWYGYKKFSKDNSKVNINSNIYGIKESNIPFYEASQKIGSKYEGETMQLKISKIEWDGIKIKKIFIVDK